MIRKSVSRLARICVAAGAAVLLAVSSPVLAGASEKAPTPQRFTITAAPGAEISQSTIAGIVAKNHVTLVETQTFYTFNGTTLTIGVPTGTRESLEQSISATLTDLVSARNGRTEAEAAEMAALVASARSELAAGVKVHQIVVESSGGKIDVPATLRVVTPPESEPSASVAAACGTWTPTFVSNIAAASAAGGRYNSLKFSWTATRLAALRCTGSSTFEPDFVTYNYDGFYYFSNTMLAWATTMPAGYWDTNAFDAPEERVYTVGSSNTASVVSSHTYEAFFRMSNGNTTTDKAKVVWQRGHYQVGCPFGPALCIFGDEGIPFAVWNIPLPGSY
jgi:hypothetical protein